MVYFVKLVHDLVSGNKCYKSRWQSAIKSNCYWSKNCKDYGAEHGVFVTCGDTLSIQAHCGSQNIDYYRIYILKCPNIQLAYMLVAQLPFQCVPSDGIHVNCIIAIRLMNHESDESLMNEWAEVLCRVS